MSLILIAQKRKPGFYLVLRDKSRHFIATKEMDAAKNLEKVCKKKFLPGDDNYWVDQYYGLDVDGHKHWANFDLTDRLLGLEERFYIG